MADYQGILTSSNGGSGVTTVNAGTGISVDNTDPANPIVSSTVVDTNDATKVSANDTTAGFLNGKLVAGTNVTFTENNDGLNETLTIAATVPVTSVNTKTGAVVLNNTDVNAAATIHAHAATDITSGVLDTARMASSGTASNATYLRGDRVWASAPVTSVNSQTGAVTLTAASVGAATVSHTHDASAITSGTIATGRLGSGTASSGTFLRGDQTWASAGVTGFTSSTNTTFPNNLINASRLLVDVTTSSGDAVIQPKLQGAFQLALADNTTTGGNKRGLAAIDLQIMRGAANNVAAGIGSIAIGTDNRVDSTESRAFGNSNTVVAVNATAVGQGNLVSASGSYSHIFGHNNSVYHNRVIALGIQNFSYASDSLVLGFGGFGAGNAQSEIYQLKTTTTNAAQANLSTDGNAFSSTNRLFIPNDTTCILTAHIVARRTDADNESLGYIMQGVVDNNSNFVDWVGGSPSATMLIKDSAPWSVGMSIDNTNKAVNIFVAGEAGKSIRWMAHVELIKVRG
jgi:hypothetical protein